MKTYAMTSPQFTGEVRFEYDESGRLIRFEVEADLSELQFSFLYERLPVTLLQMSNFQRLLREIKSPAVITETVREVSFDEFWKKYFAGRGSDNSSKKKARTRWDRMTKTEQVRAYNHIPRYLSKIPSGIGVKLAETYLNSEIYNN